MCLSLTTVGEGYLGNKRTPASTGCTFMSTSSWRGGAALGSFRGGIGSMLYIYTFSLVDSHPIQTERVSG